MQQRRAALDQTQETTITTETKRNISIKNTYMIYDVLARSTKRCAPLGTNQVL